MAWNTTRWNRIRYNLWSLFYDPLLRLLQPGRRQALEQAAPRAGERILIVGGGTGLDLPLLAELGAAEADIVLGDIAPAMLARAKKRAEALGLPRVRIKVMDAQALPLEDECFDLVLLHLILAVVPDPQACIREAARVLKPDGRVSIYDKFLPDGRRPGWLRRVLNAVMESLATSITRQLGPLLDHAGLEKVIDQPSHFNGFFRTVLAKKPAE